MGTLSSAHVQSLAALAEFKAALAQFRTEAQDALSSLRMDTRRAQDWLCERQSFWTRMVRECHDEVVHAKAELFRKESVPPGFRKPDTTQEEENLRIAKARLAHAEEKVERCRRWAVQFDRAVEEFEGPVRRLGTRVEIDLPKAGAAMERLMQRLETYLAAAPPPSPGGVP
jgi:uncharacterized protein (DUF58 family)